MNSLFIIDSRMTRRIHEIDRRTLIEIAAGAGVLGLAGCIGVEEADDDPADGADDADDTDDTSDGDTDDGDDADDSDDDGTPDEDLGEAEIWYDLQEGEIQIMESAIEDFNGGNPYEIDGVDVAEMQDQLTASIPVGEGPELFIWAHDWAGDFGESGFLSAQTGDVNLEPYTEPAQQAAQFEGEVYGLPFASETIALIYNRDMVDEPPETVAEMQDIMDHYHEPAAGEYGLSYNIDAYFVSAYAHAFGGFYYRTDGHELGVTNQETIDGLRVVLEELDPYSPDDHEYGPQAAVFADENAPFAINGPWELGNLDFDYGVTKLPAPEGGTAAPYTGVQLVYFADAMNDDADRAEAAREFTEWYTTNTEVLMELAEGHGFIPVLEDLAGTDDLPQAVEGFSASAADGTPMPAHPRMNHVWEPVEDAIFNAITGEHTLEEAMAEAEERILDAWD